MSIPAIMLFDPCSGEPKPYPSETTQYRSVNPTKAWLFNPYTGNRRTPDQVGVDVFGCEFDISGESQEPQTDEQNSIEFEGTALVAIESYGCIGCYFETLDTCPPESCSQFGRKDGKSIIWIKPLK